MRRGIGIGVGYGPYLRDVIVSSNVLRGTGKGIAVSVVKGAGTALITDNLIEASQGAIVGMEWEKRVTGDMAKDGPGRYAQSDTERKPGAVTRLITVA